MPDIDRVVVLQQREAELLSHVLVVFERLLRQGELQPHQLQQLVPDGIATSIERADVEMAEVVVDAGVPLRRQLD
jgi:hypothetical protein